MGRVLLLIVGFVVALGLGASSQPGQSAGSEQAAAEKRIAATAPSPVQQTDEANDAGPPCGEGQYDSSDDLCAQWKAADAAAQAAAYAAPLYWLSVLGAVIGFLTAIFAGGAAWFAKRAADAARAQLAHAETATERQLRAYVSVVKAHLKDIKEGAPVRARIDLRNSGQTPAYGLRCLTGIRIVASGEPWPLEGLDFSECPAEILGAGCEHWLNPWRDDAMTADEAAGICSGRLSCQISLVLDYTDVFGVAHRTDGLYIVGQHGKNGDFGVLPANHLRLGR